MSVNLATSELLQQRNIEGMGLMNRIALMSMSESLAGKSRYAFVDKIVQRTPPLDSVEDGKALRLLATQVRRDGSSK